ncbi:hypothetical protein [Brevibacillus brevis]|uniref:hypothetical protein n=1 Tax=Brevibacillus brevis TaxID=1393 RepID=UPI001FD2EC71|nr:hypothetical protein [Brevibacillus brevis]
MNKSKSCQKCNGTQSQRAEGGLLAYLGRLNPRGEKLHIAGRGKELSTLDADHIFFSFNKWHRENQVPNS